MKSSKKKATAKKVSASKSSAATAESSSPADKYTIRDDSILIDCYLKRKHTCSIMQISSYLHSKMESHSIDSIYYRLFTYIRRLDTYSLQYILDRSVDMPDYYMHYRHNELNKMMEVYDFSLLPDRIEKPKIPGKETGIELKEILDRLKSVREEDVRYNIDLLHDVIMCISRVYGVRVERILDTMAGHIEIFGNVDIKSIINSM